MQSAVWRASYGRFAAEHKYDAAIVNNCKKYGGNYHGRSEYESESNESVSDHESEPEYEPGS